MSGKHTNTAIWQRSRTEIHSIPRMVKRPHCVVKPFFSGGELDSKTPRRKLSENSFDCGHGLPHFGSQPFEFILIHQLALYFSRKRTIHRKQERDLILRNFVGALFPTVGSELRVAFCRLEVHKMVTRSHFCPGRRRRTTSSYISIRSDYTVWRGSKWRPTALELAFPKRCLIPENALSQACPDRCCGSKRCHIFILLHAFPQSQIFSCRAGAAELPASVARRQGHSLSGSAQPIQRRR